MAKKKAGKQRCEVCRERATKTIQVAEYRIHLCAECCEVMIRKAEQNGVGVERGHSFDFKRPTAGLMQRIVKDNGSRQLMKQTNPDHVCLWLYPHEDWEIAAKTI